MTTTTHETLQLPDLDAMSSDDLLDWALVFNQLWSLCYYRGVAATARNRGDTDVAEDAETIATRIYSELPYTVQW